MVKEEVKQKILQEASGMGLTCRKAFAIAEEMKQTPEEIGRLCDELKIKIIGCRLGCF